MYLDAQGNPIADKSINGYLAVGTPGTVLGLETARQEYGTMSRQALIAPAIHLAEQGFTLTRGDVDVFAEGNAAFRRQPNVSAIFLHDSEPLRVGDLLVQKDLGRTLHAISAGGTDAFYHGAIAATVAAASKANGGILTAEDFAGYTVDGIEAHQLQLPRLPGAVGAAAEFGRSNPVRDAEHPRGLPDARLRLPLQRVAACADRSDALCLSRPQQLSRRSGLRQQPDRAAAVGAAYPR